MYITFSSVGARREHRDAYSRRCHRCARYEIQSSAPRRSCHSRRPRLRVKCRRDQTRRDSVEVETRQRRSRQQLCLYWDEHGARLRVWQQLHRQRPTTTDPDCVCHPTIRPAISFSLSTLPLAPISSTSLSLFLHAVHVFSCESRLTTGRYQPSDNRSLVPSCKSCRQRNFAPSSASNSSSPSVQTSPHRPLVPPEES